MEAKCQYVNFILKISASFLIFCCGITSRQMREVLTLGDQYFTPTLWRLRSIQSDKKEKEKSEAPPTQLTHHPLPPQSAPEANQTGEVRLLSKLLNQKVDTVRCVRSGEAGL